MTLRLTIIALMLTALTAGAWTQQMLMREAYARRGAAPVVEIGNAVDLDGSSEYFTDPIAISNSLTGATSLTILFWAKPSGHSASDGILALRPNVDGSGLNGITTSTIASSTNLSFYHNAVQHSSAAKSFLVGSWHFVMLTWSISNKPTWRIDGTNEYQGAAAAPVTAINAGVASIGNDPAGAGRLFSGEIDDLAVFKNRELTSADYSELWGLGTNPKSVTQLSTGTNGIVKYWKFDESGSASNAYDSASGTTATGTAIGSGDWVTGKVPK